MSAIIDSLYASLQSAPENWQFRLGLIEALQAEGRTQEIHTILSGVTALPEDPKSLVMAGQAYGILDVDNGIEVLNGLIAGTPTYAPAYLEKARLLVKKGDLKDASTQYTMATTLDGSLADAKLAGQLGIGQPQPAPAAPPTEAAPAVLVQEAVPATPAQAPAPVTEVAAPVAQPQPEVYVQPPAAYEPSEYYHPQPGEYPTLPLSEANVAAPAPLVDPNSVPEQPGLIYEEVDHLQTQYTDQQQFLEQVNNVDVNSVHYEQPVTYDYQQPDDTIFAPAIGADQIYVGAAQTIDGELVAPLHEVIKERAEERKRINKAVATKNKIVSFCTALLVIIVACLLMLKIVSELPRPKQPEIVAVQAPYVETTDIEQEVVEKKQVEQTPVAPPVSFDVVSTTASSSVAISNLDIPFTDFAATSPSASFETSMSFGGTTGGPVSFFGSSSAASKVVFVVDASLSMKATGKGTKVKKVDLMKKELIKTVNALPENVDFQILFFSGPSWFLDITPLKDSTELNPQVTVKKHYHNLNKRLLKDWTQLGKANFWEYKGGDPANWPKQEYIRSTPSNRRLAIEMIKGTPLLLGTDWRDPLKMAMVMEPDTIYFMTDGAVGKHPTKKPVVDELLSFNRKHSKATINTVCMMVLKASDMLQELAEKTRGEFVLVKEDGTSVTGSELDRLIRSNKK